MIIAGLDPGKTGALVTLFEDGSTVVDRVPLLPPLKGGKKSTLPDYQAWSRNWRMSLEFNRPDVIVMEKVGAWSGQGVKSVFSFGKSTGFALATIYYIDVPIHDAEPNVWKPRMGLSNDKALSIEQARELIPSLIPHLTRKKDDGVAEAGLLAYFGRMTIRG